MANQEQEVFAFVAFQAGSYGYHPSRHRICFIRFHAHSVGRIIHAFSRH
jgi:hypothetical protein